jgi:hypothetical protein
MKDLVTLAIFDEIVKGFWEELDLVKIGANEEELIKDKEILTITDDIVKLESKLQELKTIEDKIKAGKEKLLLLMEKSNVKKFETINGVKISRIDAIETVKSKFDVKQFQEENEALYDIYCSDVVVKRKGSVRITIPKKDEE